MVSSPERFQALVENSPDAISLVNEEGQVLYASGSTTRVLGYRPEELLGQNSLDLLHPQDRPHSLRTLKKVLAEPRRPKRMHTRVRHKDGQWRWMENTACNFLDEPHIGAILINYRELGTRRIEDEERQRLVEELTCANATLQAFAYTVAHDLKEPLRTISVFTELLVRKARPDAGDEIAKFVVDGVRRLSVLLDDLLSSAVNGSSDLCGPVKLEHAVAQAMLNLKAALISSEATVTIGPMPTVHGVESDLERLFQNLISNAVKYRTRAPVEVHIAAERLGRDWVIRVRDNGMGIAKEHHHRIFSLFTRLQDEEVPGMGIGLAICKKIVEGMGGTIWVESEPGVGSTFCFKIARTTFPRGVRSR